MAARKQALENARQQQSQQVLISKEVSCGSDVPFGPAPPPGPPPPTARRFPVAARQSLRQSTELAIQRRPAQTINGPRAPQGVYAPAPTFDVQEEEEEVALLANPSMMLGDVDTEVSDSNIQHGEPSVSAYQGWHCGDSNRGQRNNGQVARSRSSPPGRYRPAGVHTEDNDLWRAAQQPPPAPRAQPTSARRGRMPPMSLGGAASVQPPALPNNHQAARERVMRSQVTSRSLPQMQQTGHPQLVLNPSPVRLVAPPSNASSQQSTPRSQPGGQVRSLSLHAVRKAYSGAATPQSVHGAPPVNQNEPVHPQMEVGHAAGVRRVPTPELDTADANSDFGPPMDTTSNQDGQDTVVETAGNPDDDEEEEEDEEENAQQQQLGSARTVVEMA